MNTRNKIIIIISIAVIILGVVGGYIYYSISSRTVYIENSSVSAPVINLSPKAGGILEEVFVNVGDLVQDSAPIARVGNELIKAQSDGQIISINTNIGAPFIPGQAVATMINPNDSLPEHQW